MKKNQALPLFLALVLIGCSSGPKVEARPKSETSAEFADLSAPSANEPAPEALAEKPAEQAPSEKVTVPSSNQEDQGLAEAIRSNNEEAIYRSAIQILSKNPSDIKALNALGLYHYRKSHWAAAQLMFGRALKVAPNLSDLHNNMALVMLAQKEKRDAIKEFRRAIELNPNDANAAANIGSIYVEEQDYTKALVALEIAYRKNARDQRVLNNYAIAMTATGKYPEAKGVYKQALKLNENNKDVMLNYAGLFIEQLNQNQEGLDLLSKVKFLGPSPEARNKINVLENKAKAGLK